jgi:hypothetical protein
MHRHGPCTLQGPVTLDYPWWAPPRKVRKRSGPDVRVRSGLVERVRREIADGTYDTPERWEAALDKLARAMRLP